MGLALGALWFALLAVAYLAAGLLTAFTGARVGRVLALAVLFAGLAVLLGFAAIASEA